MNVREHMHLNKTEGEVGIEIEVEGHNLELSDRTYWREEQDGSLRGVNVEYVLRKPLPRDQVLTSLRSLKANWIKNKSKTDDTERAGVHVHVNAQELNIEELGTFICLYYCFETLLMRFCGESREGNLFCLRIKDAEGPIHALDSCLELENLMHLHTDQVRYSSLNLKALRQYGSLEFRGMRSTSVLKDIYTWVRILLRIKDAAIRLQKPSRIAGRMSEDGVLHFMKEIFGDLTGELIKTDGYEREVYEDMRRVQSLIFHKGWKKINEKDMPFGLKLGPVEKAIAGGRVRKPKLKPLKLEDMGPVIDDGDIAVDPIAL
jgi:hypothetical protein